MSDAAPEPLTQEGFQRLSGIDDAQMARLRAYVQTLTDWNARMNLVSPGSLADLWRRHMLDSAQLAPLMPAGARRLIDIGSGAGFPGLVLAALLGPRVGLETILIESIEKKCAFLRAAAEAMGITAHVRVLRGRAEDGGVSRADVVTARAVAPLETLLGYAARLVRPGGICLFPKGRTAADELTAARRSWTIDATVIPSQSDPAGSIVVIRSLAPKGRRP